jgi:hypothetical protein
MISLDQLARLAELYDRYQNCLLPLSQKRIDAGREFNEMLQLGSVRIICEGELD